MKNKGHTPSGIKKHSGEGTKSEKIEKKAVRTLGEQEFLTGFTLIELMVVIAIIGILTAIVTPQLASAIAKAKIGAAKAETKSIMTAIIAYKNDKGYYPGWDIYGNHTYSYYYGNAESLNDYLMAPGAFYLDKKIGKDPWGNGYYYHMYTAGNPYVDVVFYSIGPDRTNSSWNGSLWITGAFAGDDVGIMIDD